MKIYSKNRRVGTFFVPTRDPKRLSRLIMACLLTLASNSAFAAEDRIDLEQIEIQGASELPKVLYIVPWKRAEIDNSPVEVNSMVDQVMMPIDREVLRRKIDYFEQGVFGE